MSRFTRWAGLLLALGLAAPALSGERPSRRGTRPNIVLIVADDLGYGDLGVYGQEKIKTPNLDQLAAEGMRFTQAYAGNTVCAPSRCSLLTGRHTGRTRVRSNIQVPLAPEDVTIAEVLRSAGYRNGAIGKWGLGWEGTTGHPNRQGFDEFFGYLDHLHAHEYYPEFLWRNEAPFFLTGNQQGRRADYAPVWLLRAATNFIRINEDRPFFLYFAPTLPHANNERGTNGMEVPSLGQYAGQPWPAPERAKAAMITYLDDQVGRITADLRARRLADVTLVMFTSDNGPHQEGGVDSAFFRSSGPFRGFKRDLYEGGIRVPLIAWWPGHIQAGSTNRLPVAFWDVLPTLAEIAETTAPRDLDGISFVPSLLGKKQAARPGGLYWEFHERGYQKAARLGDWKGVKLALDQPLELYELGEDPEEKNNVAALHPDVVAHFDDYLGKTPQPWEQPVDRSTNAAGPAGRPSPPNPAQRVQELLGRTNPGPAFVPKP